MSAMRVLAWVVRRWFISLPILLATAVAFVLVFQAAPAQAEGSFALSILPSIGLRVETASAGVSTLGGYNSSNPYTSTGGANVLAALLQQLLTAEVADLKVASAGPGVVPEQQ